MRVLNIEANAIDQLLGQLDGIVQEDVISERGGIYGWRTRHDVIATVIAKWKFADQDELFSLIERLTRGLNPTLRIELETAIALATDEGGISRITDVEDQIDLFNKLIEMIPDHRTPRRRLVRLFLKNDRLSDAEHEIAKAERYLGGDQVLARYKAMLHLRRAGSLPNLEMNDRKAILQDAEGIIRRSIGQHGPDLYTFRALGEVGLAVAGRFNDFTAVDDAIAYLEELGDVNADPEIQKVRRLLQSQLRSIENGVAQDDFKVDNDDVLTDA